MFELLWISLFDIFLIHKRRTLVLPRSLVHQSWRLSAKRTILNYVSPIWSVRLALLSYFPRVKWIKSRHNMDLARPLNILSYRIDKTTQQCWNCSDELSEKRTPIFIIQVIVYVHMYIVLELTYMDNVEASTGHSALHRDCWILS
jgi:hypothetical protein